MLRLLDAWEEFEITSIIQEALDYSIYDLRFDQLHTDNWCTTYDEPFGGIITPGYPEKGGICGINFDDIVQDLSFTRPVISPTCESGSGGLENVWTPWIEPH